MSELFEHLFGRYRFNLTALVRIDAFFGFRRPFRFDFSLGVRLQCFKKTIRKFCSFIW